MFDVREFPSSATAGPEDAHVEELFEEEVFVFAAEGVRGIEVGEFVGELAEGAAEGVVFAVVVGLVRVSARQSL